jgi:thiamine biosynthesis lipoprotein
MKRLISLFLILSSLTASLCTLSSCTPDPEPRSKSYYGIFDTVTTVYDYSGMSAEEFSSFADGIYRELSYFDRLFDIYESHAEGGIGGVFEINAAAGKGAVNVPEELIDFLEFAIEMHGLTGGEVNVAMGAVTSLWHKARKAATREDSPIAEIPSREALEAAAEHTDIGSLVIDRETLSAALTDSEASLDVGAIAKGYAVERVAERLSREGYSGIVIDAGGNLRTVGEKPSGKGWVTGVKNPDSSARDPYARTFEIKNASAVTSGDYERYFTVGGVRYHHIIDKDTLMPRHDYRSVSIVCRDSGLADALSTALFNMDYAAGCAVIDTLEGAYALWVLPSGEIKEHGDMPN